MIMIEIPAIIIPFDRNNWTCHRTSIATTSCCLWDNWVRV